MKSTTLNPSMIRLCVPSFLVVLCFLMTGCSSSNGSNARQDATHAFVGIDTSQSARSYLGAYALMSSQLAGRLVPQQDRLTLFRLDYYVQEFSDASVAGSREKIFQSMITQIKPGAQQGGTRPAVFWSEIARRAQAEQDRVIIVFFSDGDNDDPKPESKVALKTAAKALAKNPRVVSVVICGAEPRNWAQLRKCFDPLGTRFHLISPSEMSIARLEEYMNGLKTASRSL